MPDQPSQPHLMVFFTWDVSLKLWHEKGMLSREVRYYNDLAARGVQITFLTWGDADDLNYASCLHPSITVTPLYTLIPKPSHKALRALSSLLMLWSARHILKQASLFKTNQMWGSWCAAFAKILYKKPLIVRTGFELMRFTILHGHSTLRKRFIAIISRLAYRQADLIYLATEDDANFVTGYFKIPRGKIQIRPNWIDTSIFAPQDVKKQDNKILFVGRLTEQKNLPLLMDALALMKEDITLDLVGQGELADDIKHYAMLKEVDVNFLGRVNNEDLPNLISASSIFVLPSKFEGNPKTLLEAMSCGAAVLGTSVEGIASVIQDGISGLLAKEDAGDIAQKLSTLLNDKKLQQQLGLAARQQIMDTQDINHLIALEQDDITHLLRSAK